MDPRRTLTSQRFSIFAQDVTKRLRAGYENFEGAVLIVAWSSPKDYNVIETQMSRAAKDGHVSRALATEMSAAFQFTSKEERDRAIASALVRLEGAPQARGEVVWEALDPSFIGQPSATIALTARSMIDIIDGAIVQAPKGSRVVEQSFQWSEDDDVTFVASVEAKVERAYDRAGWLVEWRYGGGRCQRLIHLEASKSEGG